MISLFNGTLNAEEVKVGVTVSKYAAKAEITPEELSEYEKVCKEIGLDSPAVRQQKLKQVLEDENIRIYDGPQVVNYLDKELGDKWEWMGLRPADVEHLDGWSQNYTGARRVHFSHRMYTKPVPLPVLLTVKKILEKVPDVHFYVSGTKKDGDPFLCIAHRESDTFIIERWDEPSFREK